MDIPNKKRWRQDWDERDVGKILEIARGIRSRYSLNDITAWAAAEETYVSTQAPGRRKGQLHARL